MNFQLYQKELVTSRLVTSMPPIGSLDTTVRRSYGYIGRFSAATSSLFSKISLLWLEIGECDNDVVVGEPAGAWKSRSANENTCRYKKDWQKVECWELIFLFQVHKTSFSKHQNKYNPIMIKGSTTVTFNHRSF